MKAARTMVEEWEREFASHEFLVTPIAQALDAAYNAGIAGRLLTEPDPLKKG